MFTKKHHIFGSKGEVIEKKNKPDVEQVPFAVANTENASENVHPFVMPFVSILAINIKWLSSLY